MIFYAVTVLPPPKKKNKKKRKEGEAGGDLIDGIHLL